MLRTALLCCTALLACGLFTPPAQAQVAASGGLGLTVSGAAQRVAFRSGMVGRGGYDTGTGLEGRVTFVLTERIGIYAGAGRTGLTLGGGPDSYTLEHAELGGLLLFETDRRLIPFISLGATGVRVGEAGRERTGGGVVAGLGMSYQVWDRVAVRAPSSVSRGELGRVPSNPNRSPYHWIRFGAGLGYSF
jgi:hypothetical protein